MGSRTDVAWDDPAYTEPPPIGGLVATCFVVLTGFFAATYLYSLSVPGSVHLFRSLSVFSLLVIAAIWVVDLVVHLALRSKGLRPMPWRLVIIAGMAVLVVVATAASAPLRVRFELARGDFDAYAEQVLSGAGEIAERDDDPGILSERASGSIEPDTPGSIGSFAIRGVRVMPEGLIIYDEYGSIADDSSLGSAGFAYLPHGTPHSDDGAFESLRFRSLGGDWYAFTSSG